MSSLIHSGGALKHEQRPKPTGSFEPLRDSDDDVAETWANPPPPPVHEQEEEEEEEEAQVVKTEVASLLSSSFEEHGYDEDNKELISRAELTPLHSAAMSGKLEAVKRLIEDCPESMKQVTSTGETCLHIAVRYNKGKVIQFLLKWIGEKSFSFGYLINTKGPGGNTALHIATSRKQLQTLKLLLNSNQSLHKIVQVNAKNSGGFTPLDILDVLPNSGKIDKEIEQLLRRAGARRARDMIDQSLIINNGRNYGCRRNCYNPSHISTLKTIIRLRKEDAYNAVMLLAATLLTTITYQAGFRVPLGNSKEAHTYSYSSNGILHLKKQVSSLTQLFILFNSTGFISSVAVVMFLLHEFPMKPWPQISVSTMFGAYMCSIMAVSPNQAWVLLLLAIPFLLFASCGKLCGLGRHL